MFTAFLYETKKKISSLFYKGNVIEEDFSNYNIPKQNNSYPLHNAIKNGASLERVVRIILLEIKVVS